VARVFVTNQIPGTALDRLGAEHDTDVWPERTVPPLDELRRRAADAEGLLSMLTDRVDAELIEASPNLRTISNYAVGVDNIDLAAATARGIPVGNTPGVLTDSTADMALALMLAACRRIVESDAVVRRGEWLTWEPEFLIGYDLHGSTVGIVGYGRIGRAVARRVEGFGCEVLYTRETPLEELLERSDFVTLHVPLNDETRGMIGAAALNRMKPTAYLVNTARGPIVDQEALSRALREGKIAGAALDVTDPEPLPADDPLLGAPSLTVVPHLGSATHATREAMADLAVDNLLAALAGRRMPHCANPEVYDSVP
jgi:lactate dehydrogenase-like 2-hydroxyacid dehydrogenase